MSAQKFSDEEKALLTEEELAGLEDDTLIDEGQHDDDGDEEAEVAAAVDALKKDEDPADKAKKAEEEPADPGSAADDAEKAKADAAAEAAKAAESDKSKKSDEQPAAPKPEVADKNRSLPDWKAPENAEQKLKAIDDAIDALATKFDDGELTAAELRAQTRDLDNQRRDLDRQMLKAQMAEESAADAIERSKNTWFNKTVVDFLGTHPEYSEKPLLNGALNQAVMELQSEQIDNQFDPDILVRADAKVREQLGLAPRAGAKPADKAKTQRELPPSLAHVPASDVEDVEGNSEFGAVDRLEGTAYEAALARMSDEQRERYLSR